MCIQNVGTKCAYKIWVKIVGTKCAYKICVQNMRTKGAYKRCVQKVRTKLCVQVYAFNMQCARVIEAS
ncbi:hypothetical protein POVWA2_021300 [Plasmodium ovale wallikeri]|uniref:Uncharacterized protein n=1 Tax=Plasmodium ovale wallikeri TaxID=864142 RepID=A0A1A8YRX9_PLAOA|nr:hypothetical protein POVWA1_021330 [Plasmodium ovale wallikeri]SBT34718.1 hypothetical protein POVWA2_021300 [Plasmodium ovale wallikeri]